MKIQFIILFLCLHAILFAQGVSVSESNATADPSAILDISNDHKGILIPRLTSAQTSSIEFPSLGLLIYDTDKKSFMYFDGMVWKDISTYAVNKGWKIQGNAGTMPGTQFIGTVDNVPLVFKTNNIQAARFDQLQNNYFIGQSAGVNNTSGNKNIGIGYESLKFNTTGIFNTAVGNQALLKNTLGNVNTALGNGSLYNNLTDVENTAVGSLTLYNNTTGNKNTAIGTYSLQYNENGLLNTAGASGIHAHP